MICKKIYFTFICVPQTRQYNLACLRGIKDFKVIIHFYPKEGAKDTKLIQGKQKHKLFRKTSDLRNWDTITPAIISQFKFDNRSIMKGREICSKI